MTLRQYLLAMFLGTIMALLALSSVLFFVNPESVGAAGAAALLLALFLAVTGMLSIIGVIFRVYFWRRDALVSAQVRTSFRQGAFAALLLVAAVLLNRLGLFAWWSLTLALAVISIVEYFFLSSEQSTALRPLSDDVGRD